MHPATPDRTWRHGVEAMSKLLQRLRSLPPGAPLDWKRICEEIRDEHERATTTAEWVALLGIHQAVMDAVEQQANLAPGELEKSRDARARDYRLMIIREVMIGANVCNETLYEATKREIAAGRMAQNDSLHHNAVLGIGAPHLSRAELVAIDAAKRDAGTSASQESSWPRALGWLRKVR